MQAQGGGSGLDRTGRMAEIVLRELLETELDLLRTALPQEVDVDAGGQGIGFGQQFTGRRALETHQHLGRLDLAALAVR